MTVIFEDDNRSVVLFGKTRRAILSLLYMHSEETFYLRQIVRATGSGLGAVQRELKCLSDAGIIMRLHHGRQILYQANSQSHIFGELRSLIAKTSGVIHLLRSALLHFCGFVNVAFIYSSADQYEKYKPKSINLLVIGAGVPENIFSEVWTILERGVNVTIITPMELRAKLTAGDNFLIKLMNEKKQFVIGDEHTLRELARSSAYD